MSRENEAGRKGTGLHEAKGQRDDLLTEYSVLPTPEELFKVLFCEIPMRFLGIGLEWRQEFLQNSSEADR